MNISGGRFFNGGDIFLDECVLDSKNFMEYSHGFDGCITHGGDHGIDGLIQND